MTEVGREENGEPMQEPWPSVFTGDEQKRGRFSPGQSGNPKGRPRGSRNTFSNSVLSAIADHWQSHGQGALDHLAKEDPSAYLRLVVALIPRDRVADWDAEPAELQTLSPSEVHELFEQEHRRRSVLQFLGPAGSTS